MICLAGVIGTRSWGWGACRLYLAGSAAGCTLGAHYAARVQKSIHRGRAGLWPLKLSFMYLRTNSAACWYTSSATSAEPEMRSMRRSPCWDTRAHCSGFQGGYRSGKLCAPHTSPLSRRIAWRRSGGVYSRSHTYIRDHLCVYPDTPRPTRTTPSPPRSASARHQALPCI